MASTFLFIPPPIKLIAKMKLKIFVYEMYLYLARKSLKYSASLSSPRIP